MYSVIVSLKGLKDIWFTGLNRVQAEEKCQEYDALGAYTQMIKEF